MKLALGTVQFGLDYGVTNTSGKVSQEEVTRILNCALHNNINNLDTASVYGNSEQVLGSLASKAFNIISKVPSFKNLQCTIRESVMSTLDNVERNSLYGMMLHDENDIKDKSQYCELLDLKNEGLLKKVGCSFYTLEALEFALNKNINIDIIQIPASCLDQRFEMSGLLHRAKEKGIEIHCRSLFLQGLLLSNNEIPSSLTKFKTEINSFHQFADNNAIKALDLALLYLYQSDLLDFGVVGCQSEAQLKEIITSYKTIEKIRLALPLHQLSSSSEILLNPSLWN